MTYLVKNTEQEANQEDSVCLENYFLSLGEDKEAYKAKTSHYAKAKQRATIVTGKLNPLGLLLVLCF